MRRRCNLAHLILAGVVALVLTSLMVVVDAQARIAFVSNRDGNLAIYVMDDDGGNPRKLSNDNPLADWYPSWFFDGKRIAFTSDKNDRAGNRQIYVMDTDGGNRRRLTNNDFAEWDPAWSPNGKRIAFTSSGTKNMTGGNWQIYVMDADGENLRRVTENDFNDWNPAWSPDGQTDCLRDLKGRMMGTRKSI